MNELSPKAPLPKDFSDLDYPLPESYNRDTTPNLSLPVLASIDEKRLSMARVVDACRRACSPDDRALCDGAKTIEAEAAAGQIFRIPSDLRQHIYFGLARIAELIKTAYEDMERDPVSPRRMPPLAIGSHGVQPSDLYSVRMHQFVSTQSSRVMEMQPSSQPLTPEKDEELAGIIGKVCSRLDTFTKLQLRKRYEQYVPKLSGPDLAAVQEAQANLAGLLDLCKDCSPADREHCATAQPAQTIASEVAFALLPGAQIGMAQYNMRLIREKIEQGYSHGRHPLSPGNLRTATASEPVHPQDRLDADLLGILNDSKHKIDAAEKPTPENAQKIVTACRHVCSAVTMFTQISEEKSCVVSATRGPVPVNEINIAGEKRGSVEIQGTQPLKER